MSADTDDTIVLLQREPMEEHPVSSVCNGAFCLLLMAPVIGVLWLMLSWLYSVLHGVGYL